MTGPGRPSEPVRRRSWPGVHLRRLGSAPPIGASGPPGATGTRRRSGWSAALGLLAALPIACLALVALFQVAKPQLER